MTNLRRLPHKPRWLLFAFVLLVALAALVVADTLLLNRDNKSSYTVGIVAVSPPSLESVDAFKAEMAAQGYAEGEDITYVTGTTLDGLTQTVKIDDLDLLLMMSGTFGMEANPLTDAMAMARGKTPILVVPGSGDPVDSGVADSLKRPGHNISGIVLFDADDKRFDLFARMLPQDTVVVAVVYDSTREEAVKQLAQIEQTAQARGLELVVYDTPSGQPDTTAQAMADLPAEAGGIFLLQVWGSSLQWFQLAYDRKIPSSIDGAGTYDGPKAMMAYGPDFGAMGTQAAHMAALVLRGINIADLPMEYPEMYLTIDMGVANAIGFNVSNEFLRQASEIIHTDVAANFVIEPTAVPGVVAQAEGSGACAASQASPGGTNTVCVTKPCDELVDNAFIKFSDKTDVAGCSTESLVGICSTATEDTYYYDGAASLLKTGCGFTAGKWQSAPQ
jgi:putative ABC transport system substrate-binding protein